MKHLISSFAIAFLIVCSFGSFSLLCQAQTGPTQNVPLIAVGTAPTGACTNGVAMRLVIGGGLWQCSGGTWTAFGSGSANVPGAGIVKSDGSSLQTAVLGTDYVVPAGNVATATSATTATTATNLTGGTVAAQGVSLNTHFINGTYTATNSDDILIASSTQTLTLPATPTPGKIFVIRQTANATLTVQSNGNNIDGSASTTLTANSPERWVYYDGVSAAPQYRSLFFPNQTVTTAALISSNLFTGINSGTLNLSGASATNVGGGVFIAGSTAASNAGTIIFKGGAGSNAQLAKFEAGGTLDGQTVNTTSFSSTPVFDMSKGNFQTITLTANVTSSTTSNIVAGGNFTVKICQDGTGSRTLVWPTNVLFGSVSPTIGSTLNKCSVYQMASYDTTNLYVLAGSTNE